MAQVDSNESFIHMWYIWRFVGIHPFARLKGPYYVYSICANLLFSVVSPILASIGVFFLDDIESIMSCLKISLELVVSSLKQFVIFVNMSKLRRATVLLNELDQRASRNDDEARYLRKIIKQCHRIAITVQIMFIFSLISLSAVGLLQKSLIFEAWFPFNWTSSIWKYSLTFAFQFLATTFQIIQNAANDAYPPIYLNVIVAQIHVLCMRTSRIGKDPARTPKENEMELVSCINDHRNIISLFETIRPVIAQTIFFQFFITAFLLCVTVVDFIIYNRGISHLINTIVYLASLLVESFPVCFYGNALMSATDGLSTAIYSCNWMDQSVKFRKCIIIFMQRSQLTNEIQAGGLIPISLQTFLAIIRFSFSLYTLLSQMS